MGLLAPLFLLGGLLAAVPVVLHLTRRRRPPLPFPSFLFLKALGAAARRKRRRIRDLPLLLLRCAALLLLALAFAQPVIHREAGAAGAGSRRDAALLLDRSLSMSVPGRMAALAEAVAEELASLSPGDRAVVIAFDDRAEALTELTDDRGALAAAAASVSAGDGGTRFPAALGLAARLLPESPGRRREAVLVSDLQRSGFPDGRPETALPPGIGLRVRAVGAPAPNFYAAGVSLRPAGRDRQVANAEVRASGNAAAGAGPGTPELLLGGRVAGQMSEVPALAAAEGARSESAPFSRPAEALRAEVRLGRSGGGPVDSPVHSPVDSLPADDRYRFVVHPESALRVADLGGREAEAPIHVREALGVGVSPAFWLDAAPARGEAAVGGALASGAEGLRTVALVRDPGRLDAGGARALAAFVRGGGGLVAAAGPRRPGGDVLEALSGALPAVPGETADRLPPTRLTDFSGGHPVFSPFAAGAPALGRASFFRYRRLDGLAPGAVVAARFADGRPALVTRDSAAAAEAAADGGAGGAAAPGRVALFASSFDPVWNDLPRRPAFVPFLHRLLEYAADYRAAPAAYRVGETVDPAEAFRLGEGGAEEGGGEILVETPSGGRRVLTGRAALRLDEAGFYRARRPGETEFRPLAANPPLAESELEALDSAEVEIAAAAPAPGGGKAPETPVAAAAFSSWWLLLAALLLLLLAETRLARA